MALETTNKDFFELIRQSLKVRMEQEFEELKQDMIKKLDHQKEEIISSIALHMTKEMSVEDLGRTVRIEIKKVK